MAYPTKIATCCFCGTKAALTLDRGRHELSCASCGAPLRDLKNLPRPEPRPRPAVDHSDLRRVPASPKKAQKPKKQAPKAKWEKPAKRRKGGFWGHKKGWMKAAEEIFDFVEDIFD